MEAGQRVRAGFPPGAKMSEVTWGRLFGEKRREEGVRGEKKERKTLWGYNSGEFWKISQEVQGKRGRKLSSAS